MPPARTDYVKRSVGRPTKVKQGQGGRERLLDAARHLIRTRPALADQRSEVARAAGVTPSLLCYYFPDHSALLELATAPIVGTYMRSLLGVLQGQDCDDNKLRAIIRLLIDANRQDPNIVDAYIDLVRRKPDGAGQVAELIAGYEALTTFLAHARVQSLVVTTDPGFTVFALWGMCRTVAQNAALPVGMTEQGETLVEEGRLVDLVLGLFSKSSPASVARPDIGRRPIGTARSTLPLPG